MALQDGGEHVHDLEGLLLPGAGSLRGAARAREQVGLGDGWVMDGMEWKPDGEKSLFKP